MKSMLLLLAFWAHGGSGPVVKLKVNPVTPLATFGMIKAGAHFDINPGTLKLAPLSSPQPLPQSSILAKTSPFIVVPQNGNLRETGHYPHEQLGAAADYLRQGIRFDGLQTDLKAHNDNDAKVTGETYGSISAKINLRIAELSRKFTEERLAGANALNLSEDIGMGHLAEVAVIRKEGENLLNVGEEVRKDGRTIGEIDAETRTHLIEVASGNLNSGKKSKIQQFIKFLRAEAKKRNKAVKYYYDPDKADPEDIERLKKIGEKQGITVEFVPIPWELVADFYG